MTDTITLPRSVVAGALHALDLSQALLESSKSIHHTTILEEYKALRAALAQQAEQGWQPIETAPRDKTTILLLRGSDVVAGGYYAESSKFPWVFLDATEEYTNAFGYAHGPTHWMPLPEAPKGGV